VDFIIGAHETTGECWPENAAATNPRKYPDQVSESYHSQNTRTFTFSDAQPQL